MSTLTYAATGAQALASTTVSGPSAQPSITAAGVTTTTFAATDVAGNHQATNSETAIVGQGDDDRVAFACALPTPNFVMPAHGKLAVSGTVTINRYSFPFSKRIAF